MKFLYRFACIIQAKDKYAIFILLEHVPPKTGEESEHSYSSSFIAQSLMQKSLPFFRPLRPFLCTPFCLPTFSKMPWTPVVCHIQFQAQLSMTCTDIIANLYWLHRILLGNLGQSDCIKATTNGNSIQFYDFSHNLCITISFQIHRQHLANIQNVDG